MNPRVTHAACLSPTLVAVTFANGETGVLDIAPYLTFPAFASLRDPGVASRVHAAHGTVVWSDELDLCPDTVWEMAVRGERLSAQ